MRALRGFSGFCGSACRGCTAEAASTETAPERQRPQRPRHSGRQLLSDRLLRQIQWLELLGAFASTIWSRVAASPFTCYAWMQPQALHKSRRQLLSDRLLRQLQWPELLGALASTNWSRVAASPTACYAWMLPRALHDAWFAAVPTEATPRRPRLQRQRRSSLAPAPVRQVAEAAPVTEAARRTRLHCWEPWRSLARRMLRMDAATGAP